MKRMEASYFTSPQTQCFNDVLVHKCPFIGESDITKLIMEFWKIMEKCLNISKNIGKTDYRKYSAVCKTITKELRVRKMLRHIVFLFRDAQYVLTSRLNMNLP